MSRELPFRSIDFGERSVFSLAHPIDNENEQTQRLIGCDIPYALDRIFATFETVKVQETVAKDGAIPLMPMATGIVFEKLEGTPRSLADSRILTLRALTDGNPVNTAYIRADFTASRLDGFSVAVKAESDAGEVLYEINGYLPDKQSEYEEQAFEIISYDSSMDKGDSLIVNEEIAKEFLRALLDYSSASVCSDTLSIEDVISALLAKSGHTVSDEATSITLDSLGLRLERKLSVQRGVGRIAMYHVQVTERTAQAKLSMTKTFVLDYDHANIPNYNAELSCVITSLDPEVKHEDRSSIFEGLSMFYRENPKEPLIATTSLLRTIDP